MSSSDSILFTGIILLIGGAITALVIYSQKNDIREALKKKGASNIKITWWPFDFDESNHTYTVEFDDADGKHQSKNCKVHTWSSAIFWED